MLKFYQYHPTLVLSAINKFHLVFRHSCLNNFPRHIPAIRHRTIRLPAEHVPNNALEARIGPS
jgi:hypothetical protein